MLCGPGRLCPPAALAAGVSIDPITADDSDAAIAESIEVAWISFDDIPPGRSLGPADIARERAALSGGIYRRWPPGLRVRWSQWDR